ncbi:hypothetical protein L3Q82_017998 [Scortum barcoo]|uniref:Uncharacterized protein n=1 Tax=Scortum barcoo TaxID=214431 RepID=A0ACB8VHU3_9TELE|nr:hypothetical protein L3Q82_017998 [Scortum barcoo]
MFELKPQILLRRIEISGDLKEKESVTITCSALTPCPHSPPKLTWNLQQHSHNKIEENTDRSFTTKIQKTITLTDKHDGYNITCSATYPVKEGVKTAEETKTLSVSYAPKDTSVSISPSALVSAGSWVNLTCSSRAKPPVSRFTWFKTSTDGPMNLSEGQIYSFNATEGGDYYCVATNDLRQQTSSVIHLTVDGQPDGSVRWEAVLGGVIGIIALIFLIVCVCWLKSTHSTPQQTQSQTGDELMVKEPARKTEEKEEDIHYGEINFSKQRAEASSGSVQDSGQQQDTLYAQLIVINNFNPHIFLRCPQGHTSVSISPSALVSAGSWVNLTCSSRAKPPVSRFTTRWFKTSTDGPMKVSEGQIYSFNATEGGDYYCVATNDLGQQNSSVIHLTFEDKGNQEFGGVVYITVKILGILMLCSTMVIFEWWFRSRCCKKPVKKLHSDTYYFRIENKPFMATASCDPLQISVKDSPARPRIEISGDLKEKESVTITCSALTPCPHSPPKLTWNLQQHSHNKIEENTDRSFTTKIQKTITLTDKHDGYNITCSATYPVKEGVKTAEETKTLSVSYAPKDTSVSISPSTLVSAGSWVNLTCSSRAKPPVISRFTWFKTSTDGPMKVSEGQIYSFNATGGGDYYCVATNDLGSQTSSVIHLTFDEGQPDGSVRWEAVLGGVIGIIAFIFLIVCVCWLKSTHSTPQQTQSQTGDELMVKEPARKTEEKEEDIHYGEIDFSKQRAEASSGSVQDSGQQQDTLYAQRKTSTFNRMCYNPVV